MMMLPDTNFGHGTRMQEIISAQPWNDPTYQGFVYFKHRRRKILSIPPYIQGVCVFLSAAGETFFECPTVYSHTQRVYVFLSAAGDKKMSIPLYTQGVCVFLSAAGEIFLSIPVYTRGLCILKRRRREIF